MAYKSLVRRVAQLESGSDNPDVSIELSGETFVLTRLALLALLGDIDGADCGLSPPLWRTASPTA